MEVNDKVHYLNMMAYHFDKELYWRNLSIQVGDMDNDFFVNHIWYHRDVFEYLSYKLIDDGDNKNG
jgi:hypothetical protein